MLEKQNFVVACIEKEKAGNTFYSGNTWNVNKDHSILTTKTAPEYFFPQNQTPDNFMKFLDEYPLIVRFVDDENYYRASIVGAHTIAITEVNSKDKSNVYHIVTINNMEIKLEEALKDSDVPFQLDTGLREIRGDEFSHGLFLFELPCKEDVAVVWVPTKVLGSFNREPGININLALSASSIKPCEIEKKQVVFCYNKNATNNPTSFDLNDFEVEIYAAPGDKAGYIYDTDLVRGHWHKEKFKEKFKEMIDTKPNYGKEGAILCTSKTCDIPSVAVVYKGTYQPGSSLYKSEEEYEKKSVDIRYLLKNNIPFKYLANRQVFFCYSMPSNNTPSLIEVEIYEPKESDGYLHDEDQVVKRYWHSTKVVNMLNSKLPHEKNELQEGAFLCEERDVFFFVSESQYKQYLAIAAALLTKGFLILGGVSGVGKTHMARTFSRSVLSYSQGGEFSTIPVSPSWMDETYVTGYWNPLEKRWEKTKCLGLMAEAAKNVPMEPLNKDKLASQKNDPSELKKEESAHNQSSQKGDTKIKDPQKAKRYYPFFAIFDEMNIARPEYYMPNLLSIMEIRGSEGDKANDAHIAIGKPSNPDAVPLSSNMFIIGTANTDESTFNFSPKVIDRAFYFKYTADDIELVSPWDGEDNTEILDKLAYKFKERMDELGEKTCSPRLQNQGYQKDGWERKLWEELKTLLNEINKTDLDPDSPVAFGTRCINEMTSFIVNYIRLADESACSYKEASNSPVFKEAFDWAVRTKMLPKFSGSESQLSEKINKTIDKVGEILGEDKWASVDQLKNVKNKMKADGFYIY